MVDYIKFIAELKHENKTWKEIADEIAIQYGDFRTGNAWRKMWQRNKNNQLPQSIQRVVPSTNPKADLLDEMGLDPDRYQLVPSAVWRAGDKWQRSFKVQAKPDERPVQTFVDMLGQHIKLRPNVVRPKNTDHMAVFSLYDPHIGKLVESGEDLVATYKTTLTQLVYEAVSSRFSISRPVLIIGHDFANSDNVHGTTTQGTPQANAMNWRDLITAQIATAIWAIDYVTEHFGTCEVITVPGNHDVFSSFWLHNLLKAKYPNAAINGGDEWYAIRHNKVGLFFTHGDVGKQADYTQVWATHSPDTWAYSTYREVHTGHLHKLGEIVSESHGIVQRYMPGLTGTDAWHKSRLYTGNNRLGVVSIYDARTRVADFYAQC